MNLRPAFRATRFFRRLAAGAFASGLLVQAGAAERLRLEQIADGVYVRVGAVGEPEAANAGRVGNLGVIVGGGGALVIGTGTHPAEGEALLEAVRRQTGASVAAALNTHGAPEHVLGNLAFARRGIPILAHRETDRFMDHNCPKCIEALKARLGEEGSAEARVARPDRLVESSTELDLGGRLVRILHFGWTQQPGSLAVFDPASGVLFAGALVSLDRIPDAQNADVDGWIRSLGALSDLPMRRLVPGYGPASEPRRLDDMRAYLAELRAGVEAAYARGQTIEEVTAAVLASPWRVWALYEPLHRRNVQALYLRLEARELESLSAGERGKMP